MHDAAAELVFEAGWKIALMLRLGRFFTDGELVGLYKSKLLSYLEYRTAAIYHARDSTLASVNKFQLQIMKKLVISQGVRLFTLILHP